MIEKSKIEKLISDWIEDPDVFLVELKTDRENNIRVFMDSDTGFSIEKCVALARFLESGLDRDIEDFQLTVSSYGITQAFVSDRQYMKYVGRKIDVDPIEGKPFTGKLLSFENETLRVEKKLSNKEKKEGKDPVQEIRKAEIQTAKPAISFND